MKKIAIIGVTASGKTTMANKLGEMLNIPVHHLDKIAWKDNYVYASQAEIIEKVDAMVKEPEWIIDGGMPNSKTLGTRIEHADTVIFYHLPLSLVLWRQTKRFFKYFNAVRPDMGGNNKQKYPFKWKDIQYARNYPNAKIYEKLTPHKETKTIIVIRNTKDERNFLHEVKTGLESNDSLA